MKTRQTTTFKKLTLGFIFLGILPLVVIGSIFFVRFSQNIKAVSISNYKQITSYFARNVEDVIESVDAVMEELYSYETEAGSLRVVLQDESQDESARNLYMAQMLRSLISKSEYISSERFVDAEGRIYSLFYDQNKTLRNNAEFYTSLMRAESFDPGQYSLMILGTVEESKFCVNTDAYIFSLARNFYDITSVESISSPVLGTFYVDVDVTQIQQIVQKMELQEGQAYVCNLASGTYLYSKNTEDYLNGADPLADIKSELVGDKGHCIVAGTCVFYERIGKTDQYAVIVLGQEEIFGGLFENALVVILILCFAVFILLALYMFFSRRMSQPAAELKRAMEEVQKGNLDVRAEVVSKDEMQYISEGFNHMVEELQTHIREVYVAQICQKEAELNALKMQIQPHYLYNTLDVIRMTALEHQDEETAKLLESLAAQLRYVLGKQNERLPVKREMEMLGEYFVIMKVRYQNRIQLRVSVSEEDEKLLIPKMLLQPVVENAVRHGLKQKKGRGLVAVEVKRCEEYLEIIVMDDGVGIKEAQLNAMQRVLEHPELREAEGVVSIGMRNVYDRIKLNCGEEYGYTIQSVEGMGTIVTFHLPIWKEEESDVEDDISR